MTTFLELEDFLAAARRILPGVTVLDYGLLESALARPQASVFGEDAYPTIFEKAAALLESLARNHALADGNKRCAWMGTVLFLGLNGVAVPSNPDNDESLVIAVAAGQPKVSEIASELAKLAA
ncbi:MAG: type II toxin-antitoxin system death-on-curing family toxin [Acidimicrobiales bacterium]|nr:MAG: type II toxin-antitoxin system death-on-curing family toxin [Acidimicrobiales bacterium]